MKTDVFISYSRKDSEVVKSLIKALDEAEISYFIDNEGISGGEHFIEVITKQILACKSFLFIGSSHSYESKWVMKEIAFAFQEKANQNILPIIIDKKPIPSQLKFLFADVNVLSLSEQDNFEKVIKALSLMLGRRHSSPFNFTDFMEKWQTGPHSPEEDYLLELFAKHFKLTKDFDLNSTDFYKDNLSPIVFPHEIILPKASWMKNYDWDLLKRLIVASYTNKHYPICGYSFKLSKAWKQSPQSNAQLFITIDSLDGHCLNKDLHGMKESEIIDLQKILLKEMVDSMLRWKLPEHKQYIEKAMEISKQKFQDEISRINKSIFYERTKKYDDIGTFHEDRAKVYKDYEIGFIEPSGKLVTPVIWEDASDFSEGLACVADPESGYYGYIDKNGKEVIPFIYFAARPFMDGKALVADEDDNWFFIDKKGNIINE